VKFLLDESADFGLAGFLRELGHDVTTIIEDHPRALADSEVLPLPAKSSAFSSPTTVTLASWCSAAAYPTRALFSFAFRTKRCQSNKKS
jgi:hypothetical protein